jgi:lysyl-tRNA synthetase class 2
MLKNQTISALINDSTWTETSTAGRVLSHKKMGSVCFGFIADATGKIQYCIKRDSFSGDYKEACNSVTRGQHIAITGTRFITAAGELTINISSIKVAQPSCSGLGDKHNGIRDIETIYRARYKETAIDSDAAKVFLTRSEIIKNLRIYLWSKGFVEVETPILTPVASGAMAKPFVTHHNDLDKDFYLRIAPETALKAMTAGGFDKIFECSKSFRNEGSDRSHIQEFTSLELYNCYADYQDNKVLFLDMMRYLLTSLGHSSQKITYDNIELDFSNIPTVLYRDLFAQHGLPSPDTMVPSYADEVFKKVIRPTIIQPTIIEDYPARMSPMAKRRDDDETTCEQWQLVICGWEIVKCYSEIVSESVQRQLLEDQMSQRAGGDEETMMLDESFLDALSFGAPPQSGIGIGICRLVAILTNQISLRDVTYFPLMR